jgi:hypothetical protein
MGQERGTATASYVFFDTGSLDIVRIGDLVPENVAAWPLPSGRPTTAATALALEKRATDDPDPRLPDVEINDGLGL